MKDFLDNHFAVTLLFVLAITAATMFAYNQNPLMKDVTLVAMTSFANYLMQGVRK